MWPSLVTLLVVAQAAIGLCQDENAVVVHLPGLGHIKGRTIKTIGNLGKVVDTRKDLKKVRLISSFNGLLYALSWNLQGKTSYFSK